MHWLNLFAKFSVTERTADVDVDMDVQRYNSRVTLRPAAWVASVSLVERVPQSRSSVLAGGCVSALPPTTTDQDTAVRP